MQFSFSISELIEICTPIETIGATQRSITGLASLKQAGPGDLSFLTAKRYRAAVAECAATVVLVPDDFDGEPREDQVFLRVANPSRALGLICAQLERLLWPRPRPGVHPSAVVHETARLGKDVIVGPLVVIEAGAAVGDRSWIEAGAFLGRAVMVGDDCRLGPGCRVLAECAVGNRCLLHPGVVIGSDGFGYDSSAKGHEKLPQVGTVTVGNDVEIGANSTIDRGRFAATSIGDGTKIDNLVQIGHNCVVGRHCILCSQVGLAGSTTLEDFVVAAGQVGFAGHLTVGSGSMLAGRTAIYSDHPAGSKLKGDPPLPLHQAQRVAVLMKRLPELFGRVDDLERRVLTGD
jgi:UDP-3-O-[3-hydroxymyristoyl] glucosamine N-acyltransferase